MDRRRFVPSSEGLEVRNLLSTVAAPAVQTATTVAAPNAAASRAAQVDGTSATAETIQTKLKHIENLPFFLGRLTKDNQLPDPAVKEIQGGLYSIVAQLHPSKSSLVQKFNLDLRRTLTNQNIRPTDAQTLNNDFDAVLEAAGAPAASRAALRNGMNQLAQFDSSQRNSAIVVANHYATVLQVALGSGRPLLKPNAPRLVTAERATSGKMDITKNPQPTFVGNYAAGAQIEIVAENGEVLGIGQVDNSNNYRVQINRQLPDGKYTVSARATDESHTYFSPLSKPYTFTIRTPIVKAATPKGPR